MYKTPEQFVAKMDATAMDWEPLYPVHMLERQTKHLHLHIPHMPLAKSDQGYTVPVFNKSFDVEPVLAGLLVSRRMGRQSYLYRLGILLDKGVDYPTSINWGSQHEEPIHGFMLNVSEKSRRDAVKTVSGSGKEERISNIDSALTLRGLLFNAVATAEQRIRSYKGI